MNIRQSIERFFEAWSEKVVSHRWLFLLITLSITFAVVPQIRHGHLDVSIESFLPQGDTTIVDYNKFRDDFSYTPGSVVAIQTKDSLFELHNLAKLKAFHEKIEAEVPHLAKVTSLVNVRYTRGENDTLVSGDLIDIWPKTEAEIPAFREIVMNNPNYVPGLISKDETVTSILIEPNVYSSLGTEQALLDGFDSESALDESADFSAGFEDGFSDDGFSGDETALEETSEEAKKNYLTAEEEQEFAHKVLAISEAANSEDFRIHNAGGPTMNMRVATSMEKSVTNSTLMGLAIIIVLLGVLFKRVSGVVLPFMVVMLSLLMTLAIWPMTGLAYNSNTQIIPTFILAVGIADAIHILAIFYKHYDHGMEKNEAITLSVKQTAIAVLMTTVTTAVGLLSFLASDMIPTKTLGIFGAVGVMMALFYTLMVLPSLLAILPIKRRHSDGVEKTGLVLRSVDRMIDLFSDLGIRHAKLVFGLSCFVAVLAVVGIINNIRFSHDPISWFPEDAALPQATHLVDSKLSGALSSYVLLDTGEKNGLHDPKFLNSLEEIETLIEAYQYEVIRVNEARSILSVIKDTHKSLNNNDPDYYKIPQDRNLVSQELLLFESGSDDVYDFADYNQQVARIDMHMNWSNVLFYREYIKNLKQMIEQKLAEDGLSHVDVKCVGLLAIFGRTLFSLLEGTIESYIIAFGFVAIIMYLMMGGVRRGLIAFSPNVFPILVTVGLMSWLDVPLNVYTSTIGCIVIGISVDDTIHFMHHFRRYSQQSSDIGEVIHKTLHTCGRAITFTSVVLVGGFIVHLSGELTVNHQFGWLLSIAIIFALLANLILAPALMTLFWKPKKATVAEQ